MEYVETMLMVLTSAGFGAQVACWAFFYADCCLFFFELPSPSSYAHCSNTSAHRGPTRTGDVWGHTRGGFTSYGKNRDAPETRCSGPGRFAIFLEVNRPQHTVVLLAGRPCRQKQGRDSLPRDARATRFSPCSVSAHLPWRVWPM